MKNIIKQKPDELSAENLVRFNYINPKDIKGKRILDIGCGYGWCVLKLADNGAADITGTEITEADLATARANIHNPKIHFEVASAIELPFKDGSFDTVVSWEVLEHIPKNTEYKMFQEIARVLKPGGAFYMSTPHNHLLSNMLEPAYVLTLGKHRHYSVSQLNDYAKKAGIKVVDCAPRGGLTTLLASLNMYFSKWVLRRKAIFSDYWSAKVKADLESSSPAYASLFGTFQK